MIFILAADAAASDHYRRAHRLAASEARYVIFAEDLRRCAIAGPTPDELLVLVGAAQRRDYRAVVDEARDLGLTVTFA